MKYFFLIICIGALFPAYPQVNESNEQEALFVLQKVSNQLNGVTDISYDSKRELNYASENYHDKSEWICYFYFNPSYETVGFKYQIKDSTSSDFFNGTEKFELNKATKTIQLDNAPQKKDFKSLSYLYNSIVTLRNILSAIIKDQSIIKTATDTVINHHPYEVVTINIGKRRIQNLGEGFDEMQTKSNFIYKITIDKINNMPVEVLQKNDLDDDFIKTNFTNINIAPQQPTENSWFYSTYTDEYQESKQKEILQLIPVGSIAPDWTLPLYNKNENISLSSFRGKVILLDFWFKNCGPCIESVPHLNAINKAFKNKNFEILSINTWDSKKEIGWFCNKYGVTYKVLMNGKDLAVKYGASGFPTVILIDKNGKVLYSSAGFEQSKIISLIKEAL